MSDTKSQQIDALKLDYEHTVGIVQTLTDVRFKLLALVPTVSALGVVIAKDRSLGDAIGIATVGLVATIGLLLYELRNSQLYDAAIHRAKDLERRMEFQRSNLDASLLADTEPSGNAPPWWAGGVFDERPRPLRLAMVLVKHDRALALVYSAAVTGWMYVLSSALVPILDGEPVGRLRERAGAEPSWIPFAVAVLAGMFVWLMIWAFDRRGDDKRSPPPKEHDRRNHEPPFLVGLLIGPTRKEWTRSGLTKEETLYDANRPKRSEPP